MSNFATSYRLGIDVGSTTAKIAVIDQADEIIHSEYVRHHTKIHETVLQLLENVKTLIGNVKILPSVTGSAGMGISEKFNIPFVQEVIAATEVIKRKFPEVRTLIDIGGEDSKMIFFHQNKPPDIRMNGSCAGGTGAFIDQMATLLNISPLKLNELASEHQHIYPIASRCGVFAKTDVQNLLSRKIPKTDIAASIFQAVAVQTMNTLARGFDIVAKMMFIGGPFKFLSELRKTFIRNLNILDTDIIVSETSELLPAYGAAISNTAAKQEMSIQEFQNSISMGVSQGGNQNTRLNPLFENQEEFENWNRNKIKYHVPKTSISDYQSDSCFIGIDSGSTTTKITVVGKNCELLYKFYANNNGSPIETVKTGLSQFYQELKAHNRHTDLKIKYSVVTGYGEDLVKAALGIDLGVVETIAHYSAARYFNPNVSFVMDIGGQDMKAIFIDNGIVNRIELNESCSSGCGSFIQTFGSSLGYGVADFAQKACNAKSPADLGTRCTVFMNSKVKQSLRENATVDDISAGLAISVIKNALYKVLKLKSIKELGEHIVIQGGTFRNPAIHRALEVLIEKEVICTDIPELMGAYGAALLAVEKYQLADNKIVSGFIPLENVEKPDTFTTRLVNCKGCVNNCTVTKFVFDNNNVFFSGNKCEAVFTSRGEKFESGFDMLDYKYKTLFDRPAMPSLVAAQKTVIGIPRVLNMYENYPFWHSLFTSLGFEVRLSPESSMKMYESGLGSVMSDSICFPAKLVHGHIQALAKMKVNRIFYPIVIYEKNEFQEADNSYNCPIVSSYADVVRSSINPEERFGIVVDKPVINLNNDKLLSKACFEYFKDFGIRKKDFDKALIIALNEQKKFKENYKTKGLQLIDELQRHNRKNSLKRMAIVVAGRPYHSDPLINHKISHILADFGVDVLTEDCLPLPAAAQITDLQIISQWAYPNRIYNAAQWVAEQDENIQFVQFNSFGCGPDAIVIDEATSILKAKGKNHTLIRIDDITSTGSVKLRLRSMIESLRVRDNSRKPTVAPRISTPSFMPEDKHRTIIGPYFGEMYAAFLPALFELGGYKFENLQPADKQSVDFGLRHSNNEICYPATVVVGDIIKALKSGKYNRNEIAVGITQTGGQCRATTYLSLIKKAMVDSGFDDVPVIAIGTSGKALNPQPGFSLNWKSMLRTTFVAVVYADAIAKMYYATVPREVVKGTSRALLNKFQEKAHQLIVNKEVDNLFNLLKQAVKEFNSIDIKEGHYPKIGIVGEIYVKYNYFGHQHIMDWLIERGIEVVVPPILEFFIQDFVNFDTNKAQHLRKASMSDILVYFIEKYFNRLIRRTEGIMHSFRLYKPHNSIRQMAKKADEILNLASQFGEGWLIPAEIATFAEEGIFNVVSVQPFGCIANHVISKGIEKRIKDKFPQMSLLYLDFDDGTTEVNILNRLHFMVDNVKNAR